MSFLGTTLQMLIGPGVPLPAPPLLLEAIQRIEVHASDNDGSGFQITLRAGRTMTDIIDDPLMLLPQIRAFSRVVLTLLINAVPQVIMDGVITNIEHNPGSSGTSTISLTGEDVSVMMDLEEKSVEHPAQPEMVIAMKIIATYAQYGLIPMVIPPPSVDMPVPTERTPVQQGTDLEYLNEMAERYGYTFYVDPGPAPLVNSAYWGPPRRVGIPQRALSVNMGSFTNVNSFDLSFDGMATSRVSGQVQDRRTNTTIPVEMPAVTRTPLSSQPAWLTQSHQRVQQMRESGIDVTQAYSRAAARVDQDADRVVGARGELDANAYGGLLKPRGLVGVRGIGYQGDGMYYVRSVTHVIEDGNYKQQFILLREGTGAISPVVVP